MAKQSSPPAPKKLQARRTFSVELKKKIVKDFERNLFTVIQIQRRYDVSSAAVYKWIRKYSITDPNVTQVVQMKSEQHRTALLQQEIEELQRMIGQQQVVLSLHTKIFDHVSQEVGFDVKKKYAPLFSKISDKTLNAPIQ